MHRLLALPLFLSGAVAAFAAADSGLLALVPAEAKIVSSVNVQQALASPFGQYLLGKVNAGQNAFDHMIQQTGFDPRRDLQSFVYASTGPDAQQASFVLLARGNFQPDVIKTQMLARGATIVTVDSIDIYTRSATSQNQKQTSRPQGAFAVLDAGVGVFGDLDSVRAVVANRSTPSVLDPDLQALISKISGYNDAWFASTLAGSFLTQHLGGATNQQMKPQAQALQSVRQAAGGIQFSDPLQVSFDAITRSPEDAVSLADVMRFMTSLLQMQGQKDASLNLLATALDGMVLSSSGDTVHASVAIPEKTVEQLADSSASHHAGGFKPAPHQDH